MIPRWSQRLWQCCRSRPIYLHHHRHCPTTQLTHARWDHVTATWHFGCCHVETPRCDNVHLYGWDHVATTWWCNVTSPRGGHVISTIQMRVATTWCFNVAATKVSPPYYHCFMWPSWEGGCTVVPRPPICLSHACDFLEIGKAGKPQKHLILMETWLVV